MPNQANRLSRIQIDPNQWVEMWTKSTQEFQRIDFPDGKFVTVMALESITGTPGPTK